MVALPFGSRLASGSVPAVAPGRSASWRDVLPRLSAAADGVALLRQAAQAGHVSAMYQLGLESPDAEERKHWLREAAHEGHVPAMYALGLICERPGWDRHRKGSRFRQAGRYQVTGCRFWSTSLVSFGGLVSFGR